MDKNKKTLHLVIKRKWWKMIDSGEKKEEYREIKDFYINRLCGKGCSSCQPSVDCLERNGGSDIIPYEEVCFQLGYTKRMMTFKIEGISIGCGKQEWGAAKGQKYFIIRLGEKINENSDGKKLDFIRQEQQWTDYKRTIVFCNEGSVIVELFDTVQKFGGKAFIYGVWVNGESRRKGIGQQLLEAAEKVVKDYGLSEAFLEWSKPTPHWAYRWYVKNGYDEVAFGTDCALMKKEL